MRTETFNIRQGNSWYVFHILANNILNYILFIIWNIIIHCLLICLDFNFVILFAYHVFVFVFTITHVDWNGKIILWSKKLWPFPYSGRIHVSSNSQGKTYDTIRACLPRRPQAVSGTLVSFRLLHEWLIVSQAVYSEGQFR